MLNSLVIVNDKLEMSHMNIAFCFVLIQIKRKLCDSVKNNRKQKKKKKLCYNMKVVQTTKRGDLNIQQNKTSLTYSVYIQHILF